MRGEHLDLYGTVIGAAVATLLIEPLFDVHASSVHGGVAPRLFDHCTCTWGHSEEVSVHWTWQVIRLLAFGNEISRRISIVEYGSSFPILRGRLSP